MLMKVALVQNINNGRMIMHEKNIELLCDEAERLLQLNIDLLQKMLTEPNVLGDSTTQLFDREKAKKRIEELQGEQKKISNKEIVLAIVGTMKAGKSTTINAIVGKEILPNRNRPMTSIPTLIRHVPGKSTPSLHLGDIEPICNLIELLNKEVETPKGKMNVASLKKDKEKEKLLDILKGGWVKNNYNDEVEIFKCLASLNDLVRLATELGCEFPFESYSEVHKLPVIEVEFTHLSGMDNSQGTLTLLDTPGPNEAGQPHLQTMMSDQLKKASAVLAVMDYTQLNSEADEQVRKELNTIAEVVAGRFFVLVNKFDQKDRNGDDADTVKQAVPNMLESGLLSSDHVYPGSSRNAYLANHARYVISDGCTLCADDGWVDDFMNYARLDEDDLDDNEYVLKKANKLWEKSLFEKLISEVIEAAHAKAAALAVDSAAAKLVQNAETTEEYLAVRHQGLQASIHTLREQIKELLNDINEINACQSEVDKEIKGLIDTFLRETTQLSKKTKVKLNKELTQYFTEGKRQEKENIKKLGGAHAKHSASKSENEGGENVRGIFGFNLFGHRKSSDDQTRDFDPNNLNLKFSEHSEAIEFLKKIEYSVVSILEENESEIKPMLSGIIGNVEECFYSKMTPAVDGITKKINSRLEEDGFSVKIRFPRFSDFKTNIATDVCITNMLEQKTSNETRYRRSSGVWGTICEWFNTDDWGWESYEKKITHSVVDVNKIRVAVNELVGEHLNKMERAIDEQVNKPIQKRVEDFFIVFKNKVEQLRHTLIQSTEDHKTSKQEQEQLTERLCVLRTLTPEMISDSKTLKKELEQIL